MRVGRRVAAFSDLACLQPRAGRRIAFGGVLRAKALPVFLGLIVGEEGVQFRGPLAMECGQRGENLQMARVGESGQSQPGFLTTGLEGRGFTACGTTRRDCHSEEPQAVLSEAKEESRISMKMRRARFFTQFILSGQSEILRFAQNDSEGLRMAAKDSG